MYTAGNIDHWYFIYYPLHYNKRVNFSGKLNKIDAVQPCRLVVKDYRSSFRNDIFPTLYNLSKTSFQIFKKVVLHAATIATRIIPGMHLAYKLLPENLHP